MLLVVGWSKMKKILLISLFIIANLLFGEDIGNNSYIDSLKSNLTKKDFKKNSEIYLDILEYKLQNEISEINEDINKIEYYAKKVGKDQLMSARFKMASLFRSHCKYDKARSLLVKMYRIAKVRNNKQYLAKIYEYQGNNARDQANYFDASQKYFDAMKIYQETKNYSRQIAVYSKLSLVFKEIEDYDSAMENLQKAKELLSIHEDKFKEMSVLGQIGSIYKRKKQYAEAKEYYYKSLEIAKEIGSERGIISAKSNLAILKMYQGDYESAIKIFQDMLATDSDKFLQYKRNRLITYNLLCEAYTHLGNYDKAYEYGTKAVKLSHEYGYRNTEKIAHENLSKLHEKLGNYQKALYHYQQRSDIHEDIANQKILRINKDMEVKYQTSLKEKKILELEKVEKEKSARLLILLYALIFSFLIIFFIFYLYQLKARSNRLLEREVKERKKAELRLNNQKSLLSFIIDSLPVQLFLKNENLEFEVVNAALVDFYHLEKEDFVGKKLEDIIPKLPEYRDIFNSITLSDQQVFENDLDHEQVIKSFDIVSNEDCWFNTKTKTIIIGGKKKLLGVAQDITQLKKAQDKLEYINNNLEKAVNKRTAELLETNLKLTFEIDERKKVEQQLVRSELQYKTLLEHIPQHIFYKDIMLRYVLSNQSFLDLICKSSEEIKGKTDFDLFNYEDALKFRQNDKFVIEKEQTIEFDERWEKDGYERYYHSVKTPIYDENRNLIGLLGIFWDITEQRRSQQQLLYAERLSGIGELAGGIAHEIKNPLSNISSAIQLLESDIEKKPEFMELINIIHVSIKDATDTIGKLINFSAPHDMELKRNNLYDFLIRTCNLLKSKFIRNNIELEIIKENEISESKFDEINMKSALVNIIINAIQAMPQGGKLTIKIIERKDKQILIFKDTGCGISKDKLPRIFDPFYTTKKDGTGLGMGLIHTIVKFHSGTININSEEGVGTEVIISLPIRE